MQIAIDQIKTLFSELIGQLVGNGFKVDLHIIIETKDRK